jgi:hypothetical protein
VADKNRGNVLPNLASFVPNTYRFMRLTSIYTVSRGRGVFLLGGLSLCPFVVELRVVTNKTMIWLSVCPVDAAILDFTELKAEVLVHRRSEKLFFFFFFFALMLINYTDQEFRLTFSGPVLMLFPWQLVGFSNARLSGVLIDSYGKNAIFYFISLYVAIFRNVKPTLNEDLL